MSIKMCYSLSTLSTELEVVRQKVSLQETEVSWDTIEHGIVQLTQCCNNGGCVFATEIVAAIRSLVGPLINALNSERTRLSGSAVKLITALSAGLGPAFEPLLPLFVYTLLGLCARTNKVFVSRAKSCIITVIKHTQPRSILSYLATSVHHKSPSLRLAAAEGVLACLNSFKPTGNANTRLIEDVIKSTSRDAKEDVRAIGKKIGEAYKAILPDSITPLTSVIPEQVQVPSTAALRSTSQGVLPGRPMTGEVGSMSRQGALRVPLGLRSQSIQRTSQRRDVPATAEGVLACVKPTGNANTRLIEDVIKLTSRDVNENVRATEKKISKAYKAILPDSIAPLTPKQVEVPSSAALRPTLQGVLPGHPITGVVRPTFRQGARRVPLGLNSRSIQSTNQRRDVLCHLTQTARCPQQVANMPMRLHDEPHVGKGSLKIPVQTAPLPGTDNAKMAQMIRPPSVKPSAACSLPKSLIPRYLPKNKFVATKIQPVISNNTLAVTKIQPVISNNKLVTKIQPVISNYATTVLPFSQKGPLPPVKAGHPATGDMISRIGQRSCGLLSKEVKLQKESQGFGRRVVVLGGRAVTQGSRTLVGGLSTHSNHPNIRKLVPEGIKSPSSWAVPTLTVPPPSSPLCTQRRSRHTASAKSKQLLVEENSRDTLLTPRDVTRPPYMGCRVRNSPFRPRRHNHSTKTTSKVFLTSTPRRPFSSPLSPPSMYGAEVIAHAHEQSFTFPYMLSGLRVATGVRKAGH